MKDDDKKKLEIPEDIKSCVNLINLFIYLPLDL